MNLRGLLWEYAICRFPRTGKLVDDSGESDPRLLKGTLLPSTALGRVFEAESERVDAPFPADLGVGEGVWLAEPEQLERLGAQRGLLLDLPPSCS